MSYSAKHFEIVCNAEWEKDGISYCMTEDKIMSVLREMPCQYAFILHDMDTLETGEPKKPHWHIYVNFGRVAWQAHYLAKRFDIAENFVNKVKGRAGDMLSYLTHLNAPEKYQYSEDAVKTNFDWKTTRNKSLNGKNKLVRADEIRSGIVDGTIRKYNIFNYISAEEYHNHKRVIDNAFEYRNMTTKGANRQMEAIYIFGESGVGKTTYAKKLAEEKNYSVFVSSGSNDPLDGYEGEDCIILDDIRPSCMRLSDLLKMLDNNTASSVPSRYRNKVLECRLIILTTTLPIDSFFNNVFENERETAIQLMRRCQTLIHMSKDHIQVSVWQPKSRKYYKLPPMNNIVLLNMGIRDYTKEELLDKLADTLGSLGQNLKEINHLIQSGDFVQEALPDSGNPFVR